MKKIRYNSWIARNLLWANYTTITLTAFVCTRFKTKEEMPQYVRNHECTHARQWVEMFILGWMAIFVLQILFGISVWWYVLPFFAFYLWYVLEWAIKSVLMWKNAYKDISFEQEARQAQNDDTYLENGDYFVWVKYLLRK